MAISSISELKAIERRRTSKRKKMLEDYIDLDDGKNINLKRCN